MKEISDILLQTARDLPLKSDTTAEAFSRCRATVLHTVNRTLAQRDDIDKLVGGNPTEMLEEINRQHSLIVEGALTLHSPELLAFGLPELYSTCIWHGFQDHYFPLALDAWEKGLSGKTDPAAEKEVMQVYRWLSTVHPLIVDSLPKKDIDIPPFPSEAASSFFGYLIRGDGNSAYEVIGKMPPVRDNQAEVYRRVIQPALYRIGDLWQRRELSVAQEHLATAVVVRVMARLVGALPLSVPDRGRSLVATVNDEWHEVGARMVADILELRGWKVDYLGASTPIDDLQRQVVDGGYDVVALSAVTTFSMASTSRTIEAIRKSLPSPPKIMVGGRIFNEVPGLWQAVGADGYAADPEEAETLARRWMENF